MLRQHLRSIVDEAFRRRAILDMKPRILATANELATGLFPEGSPADLVERYAWKVLLFVICELLGVPLADRPWFIAWANSLTRLTGNQTAGGVGRNVSKPENEEMRIDKVLVYAERQTQPVLPPIE